MASDLAVALGKSAVSGTTLFGSNSYAPSAQRLRLVPGRSHPLDEAVRTGCHKLPQARQTYTVLGTQTDGGWGFGQGLNEHHVALGATRWHSRLPVVEGGLTGSELVRLALERSHSALQAVDVLTDLIVRHGQGDANVFLVADPKEAFLLEAAGRHWALLECRQVRAVTDVALIRQDWDRLACGCCDQAIRQGWWQDDGNKLDFHYCLDPDASKHAAARRRWGRFTLALEQQNGAIDGDFLRRLLHEQYEAAAALPTHRPPAPLAGSFLAALPGAPFPAVAWAAFGLPRAAVYFPVWLDGEPPAALTQACPDGSEVGQLTRQLQEFAAEGDAERAKLDACLERLQATFDQDAESFLSQATVLKHQGDQRRLRTEATALMQKHVQLFAQECRRLRGVPERDAEPLFATEFVSYIS